jgi:WD40 repeat protein
MNRFLTLFFILLLLGCDVNLDKKDYVLTERNLIPEGTAFDARTETIYIGSTFKRKIVQITNDGKIEDFIPEKYKGITSVVGIEVDPDRDVLWANTAHANEVMPLIDPDPDKDWMTSICSFDIKTKELIKKYDLNIEKAFLNDLTVTANGNVFSTESLNGHIYRINSTTDSLELFLTTSGLDFLNGITYSHEYNSLFVSSVQGVIKINLQSKAYTLLKTADSIDATGIDGLTFYENKLIGHQSSKVSMFHLNENGNEIVKYKILDIGDEFDSSTTGEIGKGYYYFIVNSQIRSGIDRVHHTIKPADSLKNVIIRRIKL